MRVDDVASNIWHALPKGLHSWVCGRVSNECHTNSGDSGRVSDVGRPYPTRLADLRHHRLEQRYEAETHTADDALQAGVEAAARAVGSLRTRTRTWIGA